MQYYQLVIFRGKVVVNQSDLDDTEKEIISAWVKDLNGRYYNGNRYKAIALPAKREASP